MRRLLFFSIALIFLSIALPGTSFAAANVPAAVTAACDTYSGNTGTVSLKSPGVWACRVPSLTGEGNALGDTAFFDDTGATTADTSGNTTESDTVIGTVTRDATGKITNPQATGCISGGTIAGQLRCTFVEIIVALVASIVGIFTLFLQWTTAAFNFAIQSTVVDFGSWFNKLQVPVTAGWTLFRDLANILIIGLFVFIAISIIVGLQEYGQKKLIARVIIIAILINFSYLFTLIAINASNALATTVYNAMPKQAASGDSGEVSGIGDQFIQYMGAMNYLQTNNTLMKQYNDPASGFFGVMAYALFVIIFSLSAAVVMLYGALLLFGRFIVLVMLLVLSALAFASYLSPSWSESTWSAWWHQLLRNAFLAPVMMLFLMISLNVASAMKSSNVIGSGATISFANFVSDPANSTVWQMVFGFVVILGILFGGMYIASQVATGIARRVALASGVLPGAILARGVVAPIGRRWIGRNAAMSAHEQEALMKQHMNTYLDRNSSPEQRDRAKKDWMSAYKSKGRSETLAKSSFDLMNTKAMQKLGAAAGLGGALAGKSDASYHKSEHAMVEEAVKAAAGAAIGSKDATSLARKDHGEDTEGYTAAERNQRAAEANLEAARQQAHNAKQEEGLSDQIRNTEREMENVRDEVTRNKTTITGRTDMTPQQRKEAMRQEDEKLRNIQQRMGTLKAREKFIDDKFTATHQDAVRDARAAVKNEKSSISAAAGQYQKSSSEFATEVAGQIAGSKLQRALKSSINVDIDSHVTHVAREKVAAKTKDGKRIDKVKEDKFVRESRDSGSAHPPAAGGAAPAPGH